jgi:hypothetical protein
VSSSSSPPETQLNIHPSIATEMRVPPANEMKNPTIGHAESLTWSPVEAS